MSNMSYCRFQNTLRDLKDCLDALCDIDGNLSELSKEEARAADSLILVCEEIAGNLHKANMEITIIIQGILIALLVWRVIYLGNFVEKMLKWQDNVVAFQSAQVYLNGTQREINSLLAKEVSSLNLIVKDEV